MYSLKIQRTKETFNELLYSYFLALRLRMQQLVILYIYTWKNDINKMAADLLLRGMYRAGGTPSIMIKLYESIEPEIDKEEIITSLDEDLLSLVKQEIPYIKIGSAPIFFSFNFENKGDVTEMHERIWTSTKEIEEKHQKFLVSARKVMLEAPPEFPLHNIQNYL